MEKNIKLGLLSFATVALLTTNAYSSGKKHYSSSNTGYFIGSSELGNIHYKTSSGISGNTDSNGKFKYNIGDSVKFSIGKLKLGEAQPGTDGLITPKELIVGDNTVPSAKQRTQINLLLRTLQSLDNDNNIENGIKIDNKVKRKLKSIPNKLSFKNISESELINLDIGDLNIDKDYDGYIDVSEIEAKNNFKKSISKYKSSSNIEDNNNILIVKASSSSTSDLSKRVKKSLAYMGNEERLAYDIYNLFASKYPSVRQFKNIASRSEVNHILSVQALIQKYNIVDTELSSTNYTSLNYQNSSISSMTPGVYGVKSVQRLYNKLVKEGDTNNVKDALKVACKVEVVDINDLNEYIKEAKNYSDVVSTFKKLRSGSYKHYWAFDRALKSYGHKKGCYYPGDKLLTSKIGVYPN